MPRGFPRPVVRSLFRLEAAVLVPLVLSLSAAACLAAVVWPAINPRCDLQYGDYTVNVEIQGWGAESVCQQFKAHDKQWTESSPDGPVVCQYPYEGHTVVVHDPSGGFMGALACASAPDQATAGQEAAPPTPTPGYWAVGS